MIQHLLVLAIFLFCVSQLVWKFKKSFTSGSSCGGGCSKCNAVDFKKIEAQLLADKK